MQEASHTHGIHTLWREKVTNKVHKMRAFIVLAFVAVVRADVGGYNYGAGINSGSIGGGSLSGGSLSGGSLGSSIGGGSIGGGSLSGGSYNVGSLGGGSLGGGSLGGGSYNGGSLGGGSLGGGSLGGGSLGGGSYNGGSLGGGSLGGGSLGGGSLGGGSYNGGSLGGGSLGGGSLGGGSLGGGSYNGGSLGGGSLSGGSLSGGSLGPVNTEYNKEFFSFAAPEADFEDGKNVGDLAANLKKNLRVIFIRAPENTGLENAALALAKQSSEQQTAIYVLTKQTDLSSLANRLQNLNKVSGSKPDVHFVKYRTPEDAANAQRVIQQEYERLGGNTQSHNGGIAPVLDFASKAPAAAPVAYNTPTGINAGSLPAAGISTGSLPASGPELGAPTSSYIPPSSGSSGISAPSATYLPIAKVK